MEQNIALKLRQGMVGIIPTDTIYGIVASARMLEAVERVYTLRNRDREKPCIILISDRSELTEFGVIPTNEESDFLRKHWPGAVSVLLSCESSQFSFLHRGIHSLAFRVPDSVWLRNLLRETGPLIAPSANPQGRLAARTLDEARRYFGFRVDFYADGGMLAGEPSTLVRFERNQVKVLRQGKVLL